VRDGRAAQLCRIDLRGFRQGNPKAETTVVEFFDYRCPYCKAVAPRVDDVVAEDKASGFVRSIPRFPPLGPESVYASRAAIRLACAGKLHALPQKP
jgi:protein-disulfide isomerase